VQPQFAPFFLSLLGGRYDYTHMMNDLASLDAELHRNLLFLKVHWYTVY
jgi:ubiquitin-protein ligase E3 C